MGRTLRAAAMAVTVLALTATLLVTPAAAGPPGDPDRVVPALRSGRAVVSFELTPDGTTVLYIANLRGPDTYDLWAAPIEGGTPRRLNGPTIAAGGVQSFKISPDGQTVVYWADADTDAQYELYSVPFEGGAATKLNRELIARGDVHEYVISPDSEHVVYLADSRVDRQFQLYSVPIDGGPSARLNPPLNRQGDVQEPYQISSDSTRVVFVADAEDNDVFELYSAPIDGSTPTKLNGPLNDGGDVQTRFYLTADSSTIVFQADDERDNFHEVFAVDLDGANRRRLWRPDDAALPYWWWEIALSPDSRHAVLASPLWRSTSGSILFTSPLDGSEGQILDQGGHIDNITLSPDGDDVAYKKSSPGWARIFSVPTDGGNATPLSGVPLSHVRDLSFTSDGSTVVFVGSSQLTRPQIFAIPVHGNVRTQITAINEPNDWWSVAYEITPDSERVVYRFRAGPEGTTFQVWSSPIAGGTPVRLDDQPTSSSESRIGTFTVSPDSQHVLFRSIPDDIDTIELVTVDAGVRCGNRFATIVGTEGDDIIHGTDRGDVIAGLGGDDFLHGNGGRDRICGGPGDDRITGGRGRDILRGQRGDDLLVGNRGRDRLFGGSGDDDLQGRSHNDTMWGGDGRDRLDGGAGVDSCGGGPGRDAKRRCE